MAAFDPLRTLAVRVSIMRMGWLAGEAKVILAAFALMAGASSAQEVLSPQPDNPTSADKAILKQVATRCHLHEGALYFIQYKVPFEPVIHMTRALGDTEAQVTCALQNLPKDFSMRFGMDTEVLPPVH